MEKREQKYTIMIINQDAKFLRWYDDGTGKRLFTSCELIPISHNLHAAGIRFTTQNYYFDL
jgi:hypothetical protein